MDFFEALHAPLIGGRVFRESELNGPPQVAIVSENVAKRFWPGASAIGRRIKLGDGPSDRPWLTIVGVVNEMKYRGLPENPTADPDIFLPFNLSFSSFALLARTSVDPEAAAPAIREALRRAGPALVVYGIDPMERLVENQTVQQQFTSRLMGIFAFSALLLATIGIYGVLSYAVTRRSQEISIRMALGAERGDVLRLVARIGFGLVALGLAIGVAAALAMTRWIETLLYGIAPGDPITFAAAGCVLAGVAALASLIPALRAMRLAPAAALRED
jgi:predicted permease